MSILRRTGTGRNNIDWYNASSNSSGKYFKRTGTSRNNVQWINISSNGTHNLLNRTSTGRNNISWKNTTFSFGGDLTKVSYTYIRSSGQAPSWEAICSYLLYSSNPTAFSISGVTKNVITETHTRMGAVTTLSELANPYTYYIGFICSNQNNANTAAQELSKFSRVVQAASNSSSSVTCTVTGNHKTVFYQHRPKDDLYWKDVYIGVAELSDAYFENFSYSDGTETFTFS